MITTSGLEHVNLHRGLMIEEPARNDLTTTTNNDTLPMRVITYADFAQFILSQVKPGPFGGVAVGLYSDTIMNPVAELEKHQERLRKPAKQWE